MAYDEGLAERIRHSLDGCEGVREKRMFGGLCFMVRGNMCCGIVDDTLMARIGADAYAEALESEHAREMDFTGKPMKGLVYVAPEGIEDDSELQLWIDRCLLFVNSLPAK